MTVREGTLLGRYRLLTRAGTGGMAEVWRAEDTGLHRTVAVKVVLDPIARDPAYVERFVREARLAAGLSHPNVLPVYDAGTADVDGLEVPFVVMPLVTGGSLKEKLRGPVPFATAVAWLGALASALDHAHAQGILHRDVKPGNVLLDATGRPLLADFGLARSAGSASGLTATGMVLGTPLYMAPEQAQGLALDAKADQYALAVVAFELLTGRVPFHADSPLAILHQHVTTPPAPPPSVSGEIPAAVDLVMSRALAKDPAARFPTCSSFVEALARALGISLAPVVSAVTAAGTAPPAPAVSSGARTVVSAPPPAPIAAPASRATSSSALRLVAAAAALAVVVAAGAYVAYRLWRPGPDAERPLAGTLPTASPAAPTAPPPELTALPEEPTAIPGPPATPGPAPEPTALPPSPPPSPPKATSRGERRGEARESGRPRASLRPEPLLPTGEAASDTSLAEAWEALDTTRTPNGRLPRSGFADALGTARRVLQRNDSAEARFLGAYARGGLAFADGRSSEAWQLLTRALSMAPDEAFGGRRLRFVRRLTAGRTPNSPDAAWILGLAFADVRGDLEEELDRALERAPGSGMVHLARALHAADAGRPEEAQREARRACEAGVRAACNLVEQ